MFFAKTKEAKYHTHTMGMSSKRRYLFYSIYVLAMSLVNNLDRHTAVDPPPWEINKPIYFDDIIKVFEPIPSENDDVLEQDSTWKERISEVVEAGLMGGGLSSDCVHFEDRDFDFSDPVPSVFIDDPFYIENELPQPPEHRYAPICSDPMYYGDGIMYHGDDIYSIITTVDPTREIKLDISAISAQIRRLLTIPNGTVYA